MARSTKHASIGRFGSIWRSTDDPLNHGQSRTDSLDSAQVNTDLAYKDAPTAQELPLVLRDVLIEKVHPAPGLSLFGWMPTHRDPPLSCPDQ